MAVRGGPQGPWRGTPGWPTPAGAGIVGAMTRTPPHTTLLAVGLLVLAVGCSGADPLAADPVSTTSVAVVDNDFEPIAIEVQPGEEVTWTWEGSAPHNVVGDGFESEVISEGTFTHTFDTPGIEEYVCTLHNGMRGVVHVGEG